VVDQIRAAGLTRHGLVRGHRAQTPDQVDGVIGQRAIPVRADRRLDGPAIGQSLPAYLPFIGHITKRSPSMRVLPARPAVDQNSMPPFAASGMQGEASVALRTRLAAAFFVALLAPALLGGAALAGAATALAPARDDVRIAHAVTAVRTAIAVECQRLDAAARALAAASAIQRTAFIVSPADAPVPWALCDAGPPPVPLPDGTHFGSLAARADVRGPDDALIGYAYAAQPIDDGFLSRLSAAAGASVSQPTPGTRPVASDPLLLAIAVPAAPSTSGLPVTVAASLAAVLLAGFLGWWLAGIATAPLQRMLGVVERAAAGDFAVRSRVGGADEAGRLAAGLDGLIGRMHQAQLLSVTDALTGLANRRHLTDVLRLEIERASRFGRTLGVLVLDLDLFKAVNDAYGHRAGDGVLVEFAARLRSAVREVDHAFRQGGEEFVVLLPETDTAGSLTVARRIGAAIRESNFAVRRRGSEDVHVRVTVSIGVAVYPRHGRTGTELLDSADEALYVAKAAGRDTCVLAGAPVPPVVPLVLAGGASGETTSPRPRPGG
jgi:diguanylate cyclase (GGDEF)-like protein